jgi:hypothetical protein
VPGASEPPVEFVESFAGGGVRLLLAEHIRLAESRHTSTPGGIRRFTTGV